MDFEYYNMPPQAFFIIDFGSNTEVKIARGEVKGDCIVSIVSFVTLPELSIQADLVGMLQFATREGDPVFVPSGHDNLNFADLVISLESRGFTVIELNNALSLNGLKTIGETMQKRYYKKLYKNQEKNPCE